MKTIIILSLLTTSALANCPGQAPCIEMNTLYENKFKPRELTSFVEQELLDEELDLITYAKSFIGTPYLYGGETDKGIDCSAFIQQVFLEFGLNLPRTSREQYRSGQLVEIDEKELRPNDLLFFKADDGQEIDHVALYIGDGKMIHSSKIEKGVQITDFKFSKFWASRFVSARRIQKEIL